MDFKSRMEKWNQLVNNALDDYLTITDGPGSNVHKAMKYSLMAGGKRLRPVLSLAVCDLLGGDQNQIMPYACAIEMIHTYSLIHDDLPAMDNDDYRRGIPTNHKVFGEATAILAGDGLLNMAFEIMLSNAASSAAANGEDLKKRIKAMGIIARSAGTEGMIRGQMIDMESEGASIDMETLEYMHRCKTGALIRAPILAGAILSGATDKEYGMLEQYADKIGLAFQIKDDILDVTGSLEQMGKTAGSDSEAGKSTYVTVLGLEESEILLDKTVESALEAIRFFGEKAWFLMELAEFIKTRGN